MKKSNTHKCAATSCPVNISKRDLMCRKHWFLLPGDLRNRLKLLWCRLDKANKASTYFQPVRAKTKKVATLKEYRLAVDDAKKIVANFI